MSGKIVFFGTAPLCLPFLESLSCEQEIALILTQPDRASGRHRCIHFSAVKKYAIDHKIPLSQPENLKDAEVHRQIATIAPDIAVVIAYGQWIPPSLFIIPKFKTINVHFSLLPLYRGAAPVQHALQDGQTQTGVTIFELRSKMDSGPIWAQMPINILANDTSESLWKRLSDRAAPFLCQTLDQILHGKITHKQQNEQEATFAPVIDKNEGRIDWCLPASILQNNLRAFTPWPGIFFKLHNRFIKVISAEALDFTHHYQPGLIHTISPCFLDVYCGAHSLLRISSIQPPGKKPMTPYCFALGNPFGSILE